MQFNVGSRTVASGVAARRARAARFAYAALMPRYAALLRGVSPMNAKMPELVRAFEAAGFSEVKTILASGNVNFSSRASSTQKLQTRAEAGMEKTLGKSFMTIVRQLSELEALLASDPYTSFALPAQSKRVVTFLRAAPEPNLRLLVSLGEARIHCVRGGAALGSYVRSDEGPVFMRLIEKTLGKQVSTRTWETVGKIVKAG
jgi:uncharacterized protein (DUF1697 family)